MGYFKKHKKTEEIVVLPKVSNLYREGANYHENTQKQRERLPQADIDVKKNNNPSANKEEVDETLRELEAEKVLSVVKKRRIAWFFYYIFFPIIFPFRAVYLLVKKIKIPLVVKMVISYGTIFLMIIISFTLFIISSISNRFPDAVGVAQYLTNLKVASSILIVVFSIVFIAVVTITSALYLRPIRKIRERIDEITTDNLSARLETVDSQDEFMELTDCINGMLSNIEESFVRQQNFVSDASHELKTPIAVIQGYANMLNRWGKDDPEILNEGIDSIQRESENMRRIIEQLLILARLGKMNINRTVFDLGETLEKMVGDYKISETEHDVRINLQANIKLCTDKALLLESVRALVDNAVKYTPKDGLITISCEADEHSACITVEDAGIGISKEDLPKIFDRFFRCDKARGREKGSSGLGLSIAKSIVETLGGVIYAKSELEKGSVFTIELY